MIYISEKIERAVKQFSEDIQKTFGSDVVSIVLYGSAVGEEFIPKKSDLNFLVVLTAKGIEQIDQVHKLFPKWVKRQIALPLFLTKEYIQASTDCYPIEFFNMQCSYRVIRGEDVLKSLPLKKEDIRLQCERELKGKLLQLRQAFILTKGQSKALKTLIGQSIVTFTSIFRALLYLRGKEIPREKQEVILAACREFTEIEEALFSELLVIKNTGKKVSKEQLKMHVRNYILQIQALSESVDRMKF
jgi:predicted nucleotidyltransferase